MCFFVDNLSAEEEEEEEGEEKKKKKKKKNRTISIGVSRCKKKTEQYQ